MNRAFTLFSVRGIEIKLHITFPLILLWAALQFGMLTGTVSGAVFGVIAISLLFVVVTLHELGHSFAALHYGVPVEQIVLSPIGGVAQLKNMPEKPWHEFVIAIAGPAVNFVIALLMGAVALVAGIELFNPLAIFSTIGILSVSALFSYVFASNIFLALFNLIPAFPLDGGRVFRALLAMRLEYVQATNIASAIGRGAAVLLGLYGLFSGGIFIVVIAVFIFMAAGQEAAYVRMRESLRGYKVQQLLASSIHRLTPGHTLQQAYNMMVYTGQRDFPVTVDGQLVGFLSRDMLMHGLRTRASYDYVENSMSREVPTISPMADLYEAQQKMAEVSSEALVVVENGQVLGMLTRGHLQEMLQWASSNPSGVVRRQSAQERPAP